MSKIKNLGDLADAAKGAADRSAEFIDDSLRFVENSNRRIATMERSQVQRMTLVEFLAWEEAQPARHEFIGGEIFPVVAGIARHNRVILNLARHIGDHLDGTPCQVSAESMKVQITDGILYPDVMVTCGKAEAGDEQTVIEPKLIIDVLSPSISGYDQRDKFILYRTMASLREYVLIDPTKRQVESFTLTDGGSWLLTDQTNFIDLTLSSIDLKLPMELVFKGVAEGVAKGMFEVPDSIDASNPDIASLFEGGSSDK